MPIFGFVLTLVGTAEMNSALEALAREPGVALGAPSGLRLPVVLELEPHVDPEAQVTRWLALPAVLHVDYAFADFDDLLNETREEEAST